MFEKPQRYVERVFLHCSASDNPSHDSVDIILQWHLDKGWNDIGYHFFVQKNGNLESGRSLEMTPAAQSGNNEATIAICLHGLAEEKFTKAQYITLVELALGINDAYAGQVTFHGHCEVSNKTCPVFPYRAVLGLNAYGEMELQPTESPDFADATATGGDGKSFLPALRVTSRGATVKSLQHLLSKKGYLLEEDGLFGQATLASVKNFQKQQKLRPDGVVGPRTWGSLTAEA